MGAYFGQKVSVPIRAVVVQMGVRRADIFQDEYPPITARVCVHISVQKRRGICPEERSNICCVGCRTTYIIQYRLGSMRDPLWDAGLD